MTYRRYFFTGPTAAPRLLMISPATIAIAPAHQVASSGSQTTVAATGGTATGVVTDGSGNSAPATVPATQTVTQGSVTVAATDSSGNPVGTVTVPATTVTTTGSSAPAAAASPSMVRPVVGLLLTSGLVAGSAYLGTYLANRSRA